MSSTSRCDRPVPRPSYQTRRRWSNSVRYAWLALGTRHSARTLPNGTQGRWMGVGPDPVTPWASVTPSAVIGCENGSGSPQKVARLFPGGSIDPLPEKVSVAGVPGVLPNHVDGYPPQGDRLVVPVERGRGVEAGERRGVAS